MDILIRRMEIRNFKGVKALNIEFSGDMRIKGANATGKTTIVDAFMWLLFGKDGAGDKDFPIKPKDGQGNEIHNLTTEVEAEFGVSGRPMRLKRRMEERWIKPRGRAQAEYGGNTETFWINEVETKLSEYKRYVGSLVGSEEVFTLVTNPSAFNAMEWKKRRDVLLKICGVDVDGQLRDGGEFDGIIREMDELGIGPDKLLKVYKDRRLAANRELEGIPIRIDELKRSVADVPEASLHEAEQGVKDCEGALEAIDAGMAECRMESLQSGAAARLRAAKAELSGYEHRRIAEREAGRRSYMEQRGALERSIRSAQIALEDIEARLKRRIQTAEQNERQRGRLREAYTQVYERTFEPGTVEDRCPACGQALPEEALQAALEKARTNFEAERKAELNRIRQQGVALKDQAQQDEAFIQRLRDEQARAARQLEETQEALAALGEPAPEGPIEQESEYQRLKAAVEALSGQAEDDEAAARMEALSERKRAVTAQLNEHRKTLAQGGAARSAKERIETLLAEQKALGVKAAGYEKTMMNIEAYILRRAELLEDSVNSRFPTVRWQLQKVNINGGVEDVCVCLVRNPDTGALVPWHKANGAGKINAGLEIINVLSEYYGVTAPVFIDNAESVNQVIATRGQQICLVVTEDNPMIFEWTKEDVVA